MDPLFPALPEDLSSLSDDELTAAIEEHLEAQRLIRGNDSDFLGDLTAPQIIEQATAGKAQLAALRAEQTARSEAAENYGSVIEGLTDDAFEADAGNDDDDGNGNTVEVDSSVEVRTETPAAEKPAEPAEEKAEAEEASAEVVTASAEVVQVRRPPAAAPERKGRQVEDEVGAVLVAAAGIDGLRPGDPLNATSLAQAMIRHARRLGKPKHQAGGTEERYLLASAQYRFPAERTLTSDIESNGQKIKSLQNTEGGSLVASGGLCAPLTPIYTIPQFAVRDRPVRDALPSFNADRGGVNVPVPTTLETAAEAITLITEENDALGGTFATKACLDQTCLDYVETTVTIISHCREYGNLNARAWPESIQFENELTMAQHARTAESYLLDRIKALSIQVTTADVYSATHDFIYAITRAAAGIRYRLRARNGTRLRALLPAWVPDMLVSDIAATQFDRFKSRAFVTQLLRDAGVEPTFYLDTPTTGLTQGFAAETAGALDDFPDSAQWALFIEGAFIHLDGGSLELGMVRDSTLNSTNDFQFFGETFENVVRLGPPQSALWVTSTICPSGEFPALTTALSC